MKKSFSIIAFCLLVVFVFLLGTSFIGSSNAGHSSHTGSISCCGPVEHSTLHIYTLPSEASANQPRLADRNIEVKNLSYIYPVLDQDTPPPKFSRR